MRKSNGLWRRRKQAMAKKDSEQQKIGMSLLFRGKAIFKPLNTGWIDDHVACVREWIANIFFYTKNGTTIMIDAGYNYERLKEKMAWLDIDPSSIRHILITHQDTDHVGALERDSDLLFRDAAIYLSETENRYLTGEVRRKVFHGLYRLPLVKTDNKKMLLNDGQVFSIDGIRVECIMVPGHTWGHMVYLIDDTYLFTGDTIWFGADGGCSFIGTLAEDNRLAVRSLEKLEQNIRSRNRNIKVITGHTGWTDDLDFVFAHRKEVCAPFMKRYEDPSAPYDGYEESDDTEEKARSERLLKVKGSSGTDEKQNGMKPDYQNWVPKNMVAGTAAGAGVLLAADIAAHLATGKQKTAGGKVLCTALTIGTAACAGAAGWLYVLHRTFDYNGKRKLSRQIIDGIADYVTIPDGGTGLDVGCGSGALTIAAGKRNPNAEMVGCDIWSGPYKAVFTKELCEKNALAEGVSNVRFEEGNAVHLPFADESFDTVTSNYVYHNITGQNKQDLLMETLRVLKKGGTFAIHDLMSKTRYGDMDAFVQRLKDEGYEDVRLIDTAGGRFMNRTEAVLLDLGGSTLLVGKK